MHTFQMKACLHSLWHPTEYWDQECKQYTRARVCKPVRIDSKPQKARGSGLELLQWHQEHTTAKRKVTLPVHLDSMNICWLSTDISYEQMVYGKNATYLIKVHLVAGLFIDLVCKLHYTGSIFHIVWAWKVSLLLLQTRCTTEHLVQSQTRSRLAENAWQEQQPSSKMQQNDRAVIYLIFKVLALIYVKHVVR